MCLRGLHGASEPAQRVPSTPDSHERHAGEGANSRAARLGAAGARLTAWVGQAGKEVRRRAPGQPGRSILSSGSRLAEDARVAVGRWS